MIKLNIVKETPNQSWSVVKVARQFPPYSWGDVFKDADEDIEHVSKILDYQESIYGEYFPMKKDIFNAFHYTPLNKVKVVIVGQDPYFSKGQAMGLSFSVNKNFAVPTSLTNIFKELTNSVRGFSFPDNGDLTEWAQQGVLLLNRCLTVRAGAPNSHEDLWLGLINKVIKAISIVNPQCIYVLWGKEAQKIKTMLDNKAIILEAPHPSGRSAHTGFFGCNHFNTINDILMKQGRIGINWSISSKICLEVIPNKVVINNNNLKPINPVEIMNISLIKPEKIINNNLIPIIGSNLIPTIPNIQFT